jgi:NAD(P)-dependent dehydrogenase (short-subunit alcohol dehydrogenase family)
VVLITGCSSGIGRALSREFLRTGNRVVATARRVESLEAMRDRDLLAVRLDVTDPESINDALTSALDWAGRVDVLVNNAGYALMGPTAELDPDDLRRQLETNVVGPVVLIRAVVPEMAGRGWGRIVNIGSVVGVTPTPFAGAYCASKAALHAFSEALRVELEPFRIRVLTVQPGGIASRFGEHAAHGIGRYRSSASLYSPVFEFIQRRAWASQDRPASPEELARRVVGATLRDRPPAIVRFGRGSWVVPLLSALPSGIRDRLLARRFGLHRLNA